MQNWELQNRNRWNREQRGFEETRPGYEAFYSRCPRAADAAFFKMAEKEEKDGYEGYDIFSAFFALLIWF